MSLATQLFPFGPGPAFVCKCIVNRSCESIFVLEVRVKWRWGRNRMWNTGRSHQRSTPLLTHLPEFVFQRTCAADTMGTWYNVHQFTRSVQMLIDCFRSFRSYTVSQSQRLHMRLNWSHIVITLPPPSSNRDRWGQLTSWKPGSVWIKETRYISTELYLCFSFINSDIMKNWIIFTCRCSQIMDGS